MTKQRTRLWAVYGELRPLRLGLRVWAWEDLQICWFAFGAFPGGAGISTDSGEFEVYC